MELAFVIATFLLLALSIYLSVSILRLRTAAKAKYEEVHWIKLQLERALRQLESADEDQILVGLQTLSVLNDPSIRIRAQHRLEELSKSPNPVVAKQSQVLIDEL
jgi:hypothetical protein